jgi:hypothetical protein
VGASFSKKKYPSSTYLGISKISLERISVLMVYSAHFWNFFLFIKQNIWQWGIFFGTELVRIRIWSSPDWVQLKIPLSWPLRSLTIKVDQVFPCGAFKFIIRGFVVIARNFRFNARIKSKNKFRWITYIRLMMFFGTNSMAQNHKPHLRKSLDKIN